MNPQTQENLNEYRLQKLVTQRVEEAELAPLPILTTSTVKQKSIIFYIEQIVRWFYHLPVIAKLIVVVVGFFVSFAMLQAALKLIASVISMALLAGLVYLGYNFFVAGNSSQIKE
ncbi:MAG: hypothetical protein AAF630_00400 [Cyanobacteria bacterium P01_C01_bin.38]